MQPNRSQLVSVIANGNDNVSNVLIIRIDGNFELVQGSGASAVEHLNYVSRYETFDATNDYVGVNASKDSNHINDIMDWANEMWDIHKRTCRTRIINPYA